MKLSELLLEFYTGKPLEAGGTSRAGGAAPAIKGLFGKEIQATDTVLDYGAGKYARNADWLRAQGVKCYAFDPFNHNGQEGWEPKSVSSVLPKEKFDVAFTSFVLNVVPKNLEDEIVKKMERHAKTVIHVVRNKDVFDMTKSALLKKDKIVWPFFMKEFWKKEVEPTKAELTNDLIMEFCQFGVQTSRGFQRITDLEHRGYKLINTVHNYKIFVKSRK